ncbi:NAD(P)H-binding protein [Elizabethkingia argentiflava]|uniref:NAD(P)H-binding protein n=1 Tax=Elizabethkingia argenteiflava TaxID=2681556 RepID=A0A845PPT1_9FLAO|nr:NAD(P)H-binding protein [Elizabethkingia argenteiflava]
MHTTKTSKAGRKKVALLAATGQAGRTILSELISRGYEVTAVVRHPNKLPKSIHTVQDDLNHVDRIAEIIKGVEVVISAYGPPKEERFFTDVSYTDILATTTKRIIEAGGKAEVPRLVVVGAAGSLWFYPRVTVLKSGYWPQNLHPIAISHTKAFSADINWTYFSPPMLIEPGVRTGNFRLGVDDLIVDEQGKSWISFEDYAVALVNELENPKHQRARFTIGY